MAVLERQGALAREVAAILRDYRARIERLGPETLRLRGESFADWERKRFRLAVVLVQLEAAAARVESGTDVLAEVAGRSVAVMREHLARLHRESPAACEGERCPCRSQGSP